MSMLVLLLSGCFGDIDFSIRLDGTSGCNEYLSFEGECQDGRRLGFRVCPSNERADSWLDVRGHRIGYFPDSVLAVDGMGDYLELDYDVIVKTDGAFPAVRLNMADERGGAIPGTCDGEPATFHRAPFEGASTCSGYVTRAAPAAAARLGTAAPIRAVRIGRVQDGPTALLLFDVEGIEVETHLTTETEGVTTVDTLLTATPLSPLEPDLPYSLVVQACDDVVEHTFVTGPPSLTDADASEVIGHTWSVSPAGSWSLPIDGAWTNSGFPEPLLLHIADGAGDQLDVLVAAATETGDFDACVPTLGPFPATLGADGDVAMDAVGWIGPTGWPDELDTPPVRTELTWRVAEDLSIDTLEVIARDVRPPVVVFGDADCEDGTTGCLDQHWANFAAAESTSAAVAVRTQADVDADPDCP